MADKAITNPAGAHKTVTDFRTGKDADGFTLDWYSETVDAIANGTIAVGDLLTLVVPTSTVPMRVNKVAAGAAGTFLGGYTIVGICSKAAVAGGPTQFVKYGFCLVQVGAGTPAIGDMGVLSATAGQVDVIVAATGIVAGTFVSNVAGEFLGTKDANNLAAFWFNLR